MRRGDKCNGNNWLSGPEYAFACDGLAAYVPALRAIRRAYGSCAIRLATDCAAIIDALGSLDLEFPRVDDAKKKELSAAREALEQE